MAVCQNDKTDFSFGWVDRVWTVVLLGLVLRFRVLQQQQKQQQQQQQQQLIPSLHRPEPIVSSGGIVEERVV